MGSAPAVAALLLISLWVYSAAGAHCNARGKPSIWYVPVDHISLGFIAKSVRSCSFVVCTVASYSSYAYIVTCLYYVRIAMLK